MSVVTPCTPAVSAAVAVLPYGQLAAGGSLCTWLYVDDDVVDER